MTLTETVPRGIIEAKLKGPGPGRYKLPSTCGQNMHDYTQHMKPSYSFGKNLGFSYISKVGTVVFVLFLKHIFVRLVARALYTISIRNLPGTAKMARRNILSSGGVEIYLNSKLLVRVDITIKYVIPKANDTHQSIQWAAERNIAVAMLIQVRMENLFLVL